jgi:hypothetical protein
MFKDKPRSNILFWLDSMKRYIVINQRDLAFKVQIASTYFEPYIAQQ